MTPLVSFAERRVIIMKAVVTVVGDIGILAGVSTACAENSVSVDEVTQSILDEYFCLIMLVGIDKMEISIDQLKSAI